MVGNIVMGTRIGGAAGREIADIEEDSDMARKVTCSEGLFINYGEKLSLVGGSSKASVWSIILMSFNCMKNVLSAYLSNQ